MNSSTLSSRRPSSPEPGRLAGAPPRAREAAGRGETDRLPRHGRCRGDRPPLRSSAMPDDRRPLQSRRRPEAGLAAPLGDRAGGRQGLVAHTKTQTDPATGEPTQGRRPKPGLSRWPQPPCQQAKPPRVRQRQLGGTVMSAPLVLAAARRPVASLVGGEPPPRPRRCRRPATTSRPAATSRPGASAETRR